MHCIHASSAGGLLCVVAMLGAVCSGLRVQLSGRWVKV